MKGHCVEYKVMVLLDEVEEKTQGGIIKPDIVKERELLRETEGEIVSIGGNCFEDWRGVVPEIGDRIIYAVNAGMVKKLDGREYRIISDKDIVMVLNK